LVFNNQHALTTVCQHLHALSPLTVTHGWLHCNVMALGQQPHSLPPLNHTTNISTHQHAPTLPRPPNRVSSCSALSHLP